MPHRQHHRPLNLLPGRRRNTGKVYDRFNVEVTLYRTYHRPLIQRLFLPEIHGDSYLSLRSCSHLSGEHGGPVVCSQCRHYRQSHGTY